MSTVLPLLLLTSVSAAAQRRKIDSAANVVRAAPSVMQRRAVPLVPNLVGLRIDSAGRVVARALHARIDKVKWLPSAVQADDSIVAEQFPPAMTPYDLQQPVTASVWVYTPAQKPETVTQQVLVPVDAPPVDSILVDRVRVPDLRALRVADALDAIRAVGLVAAPYTLAREDSDRAVVSDQSPPPDSFVPRNSSVTLTLTVRAPPVDSVVVPDIVELTRANAEQTIRAQAFAVGDIEAGPASFLPMLTRVTTQTPDAGTRSPRGTAVSFTLGIPTLTLALLSVIAVLLAGIVVYAVRRVRQTMTPRLLLAPTIALGRPAPTPAPSITTVATRQLITQTIDVSIIAPPPDTTIAIDAGQATDAAFVTIREA